MAGFKIKLNFAIINEWIIAILIFIFSMPVYIWASEYLYLVGIAAFIVSIFPYYYINTPKIAKIKLFILLIYSYIILLYVVKGDGSILGYIQFLLSFLTVLLIPNELWPKIFKKYILLFAITILPAIIQYCLINFFGVNFSYHNIDPSPWNLDEINGVYFKYLFYIQEYTKGSIMPRFYGIYDEPGVVGTIAMLILYLNKFNLKKWYNVVILIAGILSFSLFFYICVIIYALLYSPLRIKIIILILFISLSGYLYSLDYVKQYIVDRVYSESSIMETFSKRANYNFTHAYEQLDISEKLFGTSKKIPFATTYKYIITVCGWVPFALYMLNLLLLMFYTFNKHFSKELFICIMIPFLVYSQRPFINNIFYIILIFAPIYILSNDYLDKKTIYKITDED